MLPGIPVPAKHRAWPPGLPVLPELLPVLPDLPGLPDLPELPVLPDLPRYPFKWVKKTAPPGGLGRGRSAFGVSPGC